MNIIIYGAGAAGRQVLEIVDKIVLNNVVGFVDDSNDLIGKSICGLPVYRPSEIKKIVKQLTQLSVIIAIPSIKINDFERISQCLLEVGVKIYTLPEVKKICSGKVKVSDIEKYDIGTILGRQSVEPNHSIMRDEINGKIILVSGGGGSIGSEICRQMIRYFPSRIIVVDHSEYALYSTVQSLNKILLSEQSQQQGLEDISDDALHKCEIVARLVSVTDYNGIFDVIRSEKPQVVYHAAAYKHVAIVEDNVVSGLFNNVFGTVSLVRACIENHVEKFVMVSSDKAVRPTNIMGASKRVAELIIKTIAKGYKIGACNPANIKVETIFASVRFGNVLGSSGSVLPLFQQQIESGGPVTVTDERVTRYFMTVHEAAQLVIQAGAIAKQGDFFILEMGNPVNILEFAKRLIRLNGYTIRDSENLNGDIEIRLTGLKPGEKMFEEVSHSGLVQPTNINRVDLVEDLEYDHAQVEGILVEMQCAIDQRDLIRLKEILRKDGIGFNGSL